MIQVPLRNSSSVALIDEVDADVVLRLNWYLSSSGAGPWGYALAKPYIDGVQPSIWMHRLILGATKGQYVDHRNHEGLDNRRFNIRLCTQSQNNANARSKRGQSGFRGVYRTQSGRPWVAKVQVDNKIITIGRFDDKACAALAYDDAAIRFFGEFATLNFPFARAA